jgi:hypothetical protein
MQNLFNENQGLYTLVDGGGTGGTVIEVLFFGFGVGVGVGAANVSETSAVASPAMIKMAFVRRRGWGRSFFISNMIAQCHEPVNGNF